MLFFGEGIGELQDIYLRRPRNQRLPNDTARLRLEILKRALKSFNRPAHTREIFQQAQLYSSKTLSFTEADAYRIMYSGSLVFRSIGEGFFVLLEDDNTAYGWINPDGLRVFEDPPIPLLPQSAHPRALLESILLVRQTLQSQSGISAERLYQAMCTWAGRNKFDPQQAFNAWYAAGVIDWVNYGKDPHQTVRLTLSTDMRLVEVRRCCLKNLALRIISSLDKK